jgi:hypothetical protein
VVSYNNFQNKKIGGWDKFLLCCSNRPQTSGFSEPPASASLIRVILFNFIETLSIDRKLSCVFITQLNKYQLVASLVLSVLFTSTLVRHTLKKPSSVI